MKPITLAACGLALAAAAISALSPRETQERDQSFFATPKKSAGLAGKNTLESRRGEAFSLPVTFEANKGQINSTVKFVARSGGMTVLLASDAIQVVVPGGRKLRANSPQIQRAAPVEEIDPSRVVRLSFLYSRNHVSSRSKNRLRADFRWHGSQRLRGESNYFIGNDPKRWRTHVPHFARVEAADIVPGVDAAVHSGKEGVEYDLRISPRVAPENLRIVVSNADGDHIDSGGDLIVNVSGGEVRMLRPRAYELRQLLHAGPAKQIQPEGNSESSADRQLTADYAIEPDGTIGFRLGARDPRATVVIDPSLTLSYASFLGGAGEDEANSISRDASGNLYISGATASAANWPEATATAIGPGGGADFFVAKINPALSGANSLTYLTFVGGSGGEAGGLSAIDQNGDVALTGTTASSDYPVTDGSKRTAGANDVAVTEIDPTGAKLLFSTMFGGSGSEGTQSAGEVSINSGGDIYVASDTTSTDMCHTPGAFRTANGGGASDGFLAILRPKQSPSVRYCTYLGVDAEVGVSGLALDSAGNAYLAGFTSDPGASFPAKNAFQSTYAGGDFDGFVLKIIPSGQGASDLSYATLLGGEASDQALAIAVGTDLPATAYVTGMTQSNAFPIGGTNAAYQSNLKGVANAFVSVIAQNSSTGAVSLKYSTYLGGGRSDIGQAIAAPQPNQVYVFGNATSPDFPWLDNFQPLNGDQDGFIAKLDPTSSGAASLIYATPLGGTTPAGSAAETNGTAITADGVGNAFVAGFTTAADFPQAAHSATGVQLTCTSCQQVPATADAFVAEVNEGANAEPSVSFGVTKVNFGAAPVGSQNVPPVNVGVINTGSASLNISAIQLAGANGSDFSVQDFSACEAGPIATGGVCSFAVEFVPSQVGTEGAAISISDNAPGSPHVLQVTGIGSGPQGVLSPANVAFGNEPAGGQSKSATVTLTNTGNETLQVTNVALNGADPAQFLLQDDACASEVQIPAGGNCQFNVLFTPSTTGAFQAAVVVADNSGGVAGAVQQIALTGTGVPAAPQVSLEPPALAFAPQPAGLVSGSQTVTLQNTGSVALNILGIALTGADAPSFNLVSTGNSGCAVAGGPLAPNAICTVGVDFAPSSAGAKSASLEFSDNAGGNIQNVPLTGTGVTPAIQVSPASVNFGTQSVGISSAGVNITLTDIGTGPLTILSIGVTGPNASDFAQTNNCSSSVGPGASCTITAKFSPTAAGSRAAAISISDSVQGSPQSVPLSGTAIAPAIAFSPGSIDFGNQLRGTASTATGVLVTNSGTGTLAISKLSFAGMDPSDFSETDNCKSPVNAGGSCKIQVTFNPAADGPRSAVLSVNDNAPQNPQTIALSGAATDFSFNAPSSGATSATVTAGQTAKYQLDVVSTDGFTGTVTVACSGSVPEASCSVQQESVNVPAGGQAQIQVNVTTTGTAASGRTLPVAWPGASGSLLWGERLLLLAVALHLYLVLVYFMLLGGPRKPLRATALMAICVLVASTCFAMAGCGGGAGADPGNVTQGTPAGTYVLTVTGTADGGSRTIELSLIVQ